MNITGSDIENDLDEDGGFGSNLHPYGFLRRSAADFLGIRFGYLSEDEIRRTPNPDFQRLQEARAEVRTAKGANKKRLAELVEQLKDQPEEIVTWAGMLRDIAIVAWLRSQPDSVCQRARRKPREYEDKIDLWADENGIGGNGPNATKAHAIFSETMNQSTKNQGTPVIPDADKSRGANDPNI